MNRWYIGPDLNNRNASDRLSASISTLIVSHGDTGRYPLAETWTIGIDGSRQFRQTQQVSDNQHVNIIV